MDCFIFRYGRDTVRSKNLGGACPPGPPFQAYLYKIYNKYKHPKSLIVIEFKTVEQINFPCLEENKELLDTINYLCMYVFLKKRL